MGLLRRRQPVSEVSASALVVEYWQGRGTPEGTFGESKTVTTRFTAIVRIDGRTDTCEVSDRLPFWVGWMIVEGDTVPVRLDATTGHPTGFDRAALERQMEPNIHLYEAEGKKRRSFRYELREAGISKEEFRNATESARALTRLPKQWKDAVFAKPDPGGGLDDADPLLAPIEGVEFDTWVGVRADIVRQRVPRNGYDDLAQRRGVPAGRWNEIEAAWRDRMRGNPGLAQRFGEAYQAALKS